MVIDGGFRSIIWLALWFLAVVGPQSQRLGNKHHIPTCVSLVCSYRSSRLLLVSTSFPGERFPFVMTHVHHLSVTDLYTFMSIKVKQAARRQ